MYVFISCGYVNEEVSVHEEPPDCFLQPCALCGDTVLQLLLLCILSSMSDSGLAEMKIFCDYQCLSLVEICIFLVLNTIPSAYFQAVYLL